MGPTASKERPLKLYLPLAVLLLAGTGIAIAQQPAETPAPVTSATATPNAEDARLNTFLDAAFDEQAETNPQLLTTLGIKRHYDRLNDNTDAYRQRIMAMQERQLAEMRRQFDPARLSPAGRLSFRLFQANVEDNRRAFPFRMHNFPATNNGSPMGGIPVFMINNHRIDNVSDAEAYVARLREVERVMGEIATGMRAQAERGIVPPRFNFAPVREDGRRILTGAPFTDGPDNALFADFKTKVGRLQIPQAEKDRLIAAAREALTGPFRRGYDVMFAALDAIEPRATGNNGAWSLPDGAAFYAQRLRASTTTDMSAEQIHQLGLRQVAAIHRDMERIKSQVGFRGTLTEFFRHINSSAEFKYPNTDEGRQRYLADARAAIAGVMEAIAYNLREMFRLDVPIVCTVIGEGGSGGALGIGVGDRLLMFEHSVYTVASPEACASILWKDAAKAPQAAEALKITSWDLKNLGILDQLLVEPAGGAHANPLKASEILKDALVQNLEELTRLTPPQRRELRYQKFRHMGMFTEISA